MTRDGTNEVQPDTHGGRRFLEERGVTFRWTRYSPLSYERAGPLRTFPLALRFLRLAADIEHERMAAALGVEVGTVEGIERGNVIPQTSDVDAWVDCCGARSWWSDIFEMWFNALLACQAPAGCQFFPAESGPS